MDDLLLSLYNRFWEDILYTALNSHYKDETRVSVETGSSTGLFLFIYLQTLEYQLIMNAEWLVMWTSQSKSFMKALWTF